MLALEIQEGKQVMDAMRAQRGDMLGPSTSCVARLVSEISPAPLGYRRIILGDAWFTNVATAVEVTRCKPVNGAQDEMRLAMQQMKPRPSTGTTIMWAC